MKRSLRVAVVVGCGLVAGVLCPARPSGEAPVPSASPTSQMAFVTNVPALPQSLLREVPDAVERLARLERLGRVPDNADSRDWWLAQKTTWWGKRFDPKEFWKDRTVWLDHSATLAANRQGRLYPPPPYNDPLFAGRSDADEPTITGVESADVHFRLSDREHAFWDRFAKNHPRPPEDIGGAQQQLGGQILGSRYGFEHEGNRAHTTRAQMDAMDAAGRSDMQAVGYPPEAFTDEALHWSYVLAKRAEYQHDYVRTRAENTLWSANFLARLWVDPKLVTGPLTDEQLKAADRWKISYLQRLRREKTDESYINAYLKAWNLSTNDVFENQVSK